MLRYLWPLTPMIFALTLMVGVTGCGIAQELKEDTAAVFGENAVMDDYLKATTFVMESQRNIIKAFQLASPDATELTIEGEIQPDGTRQTYKVKIVDYLKALDILIAYPPKLRKAYHALNRAIQTNSGISGFWDQFLRTLQDDKIGELFDAIG